MNEPKRSNLKAKACLLGVVAVFGQVAQGGEAPPAYVLTAISDQAQGWQLLDGAYYEVIEHLDAANAKKKKRNRFEDNINLCVAYTKTNRLTEAEKACTAALQSRRPLSRPFDTSGSRDRAVALSNRGVVHAISGDVELARQDFQAARKEYRYFSAAVENLAILEEKGKDTETMSALQ